MIKYPMLSESRNEELCLMKLVYSKIKGDLTKKGYRYIGIRGDFEILYNELFSKLEDFTKLLTKECICDNFTNKEDVILNNLEKIVSNYLSFKEASDEESQTNNDTCFKDIDELSALILKLDKYSILEFDTLFGVNNRYLIGRRDMLRSQSDVNIEYIDNYENYISAKKDDNMLKLSIADINKILIERAYIYNNKCTLINGFGESRDALVIPKQNSDDITVFYKLYHREEEIFNDNGESQIVKEFRGGDFSDLESLERCNYTVKEDC